MIYFDLLSKNTYVIFENLAILLVKTHKIQYAIIYRIL